MPSGVAILQKECLGGHAWWIFVACLLKLVKGGDWRWDLLMVKWVDMDMRYDD
jgi:hypothetical protein